VTSFHSPHNFVPNHRRSNAVGLLSLGAKFAGIRVLKKSAKTFLVLHKKSYETSRLPKSALYLEATAWFGRGAVRILDHPTLLRELRLLERRTHRQTGTLADPFHER
jgi:hypothetical protein